MPIPMMAGGTIAPSRFVKFLAGSDNQVVQCSGSTDQIIGISQKGTRTAPYPGLQDNNAALAGENIMVYQIGETASLAVGAAVTVGQTLKSDSNGRAIPTTTATDVYGAIAPQAGAALGSLIEVQVNIGQVG